MSAQPRFSPTRRLSEAVGDRMKWVASAVVALSTGFFLLANGAGLSDPGLQYDELLFVNGALGDPYPYHDFIYREALGIPTMLMPYIGALKAWLYAPIFSVFGVSVDTIRIPAILLAALALVCVVALIYRLMGSWPAMLLAVLLATDPVYGAVSRADWGPIVLSAVFRVLALLAYFAFVRRGSVRYLWLLVIALTLGLFNKLDYVWFIAALAIAALVVHHDRLWALLRCRRRAVILPVCTMAGILVAAFFDLILPATRLPLGGSHASLSGRISEVAHLFYITVDGTGVYQYMTASTLRHGTLLGLLFPYVLVISVVIALWTVIVSRHRASGDPLREASSMTTFFLVLFAVIGIGIIVTRQATGPQHIMLLWPLPAVLLVCVLWTASRVPHKYVRLVGVAVVSLSIAALVITQIATTVRYVDAYRSDRQWDTIWSPEIYPAVSAVERSAPGVTSIITADWGLGTQMFALGGDVVRARFLDEWPSFTSATETATALRQEWFERQSMIIIYHTKAGEIMPRTTQRVEAIVHSLGPRARPIFVGRQIEADVISP
ncbi:MAG TPA: glycosyltransferase family 39 protein [Solirubrobacteraceae bacterium]|nr:glycosyltransferase family 39 protein [Solirubrobacteraceae bacterium]